jgi:hypothetical protein
VHALHGLLLIAAAVPALPTVRAATHYVATSTPVAGITAATGSPNIQAVLTNVAAPGDTVYVCAGAPRPAAPLPHRINQPSARPAPARPRGPACARPRLRGTVPLRPPPLPPTPRLNPPRPLPTPLPYALSPPPTRAPGDYSGQSTEITKANVTLIGSLPADCSSTVPGVAAHPAVVGNFEVKAGGVRIEGFKIVTGLPPGTVNAGVRVWAGNNDIVIKGGWPGAGGLLI